MLRNVAVVRPKNELIKDPRTCAPQITNLPSDIKVVVISRIAHWRNRIPNTNRNEIIITLSLVFITTPYLQTKNASKKCLPRLRGILAGIPRSLRIQKHQKLAEIPRGFENTCRMRRRPYT